MLLIKFSVIVSVTLIGQMCLSETKMKVSKPDGSTELEDAVIQVLMTCYSNKDNTIVLAGDFLGDFMERLSSRQSFSVILLNDRRRAQNNIRFWHHVNPMKQKTHIVVLIASFFIRSSEILLRYFLSPYDNPMASLIIIGWSPIKRYGSCKSTLDSINILYNSYVNNMPNAKLMCRDRTKGIIIYTINPFVNHAPEPWQLVDVGTGVDERNFYVFTREYREGEEMCTNLDFDKMANLGGLPIPVVSLHYGSYDIPEGIQPIEYPNRRIRLQVKKRTSFIDYFLANVNATRRYMWQRGSLGGFVIRDDQSLMATPVMLKGSLQESLVTYPHGLECKFLITQFRGNKSQLQKILGVVDVYSRYGILLIYVITLMFFKYLMRQSVMVGILDLYRLTCNCGLPIRQETQNVGPRIYLGCLLFFVVTMQGIFVGNLASLLTHDVPVRQVNTLQDLVDLEYTVYAHKLDFGIFEDPAFKDLTLFSWSSEDCIKDVLNDSSVACLIWGAPQMAEALGRGLHVSPGCIALEYFCNGLPRRWPLEEKLNTYLSVASSTVTKMPLDARVDENRFLEKESEVVVNKPKIMTLDNLGFAWAILGIGLACASIVYILELAIYRYQHRVITTRVMVLR